MALLTIDVDSTICQVYGTQKQDARFGYTKVRATTLLSPPRPALGDVLGVRARGCNAHTARGAFWPRGSTGPERRGHRPARLAGRFGVLLQRRRRRLQKGRCPLLDHRESVQALHKVISEIAPEGWAPIPYGIEDGADVAETTWQPFKAKKGKPVGLIVRRTKPTPGTQLALLATHDDQAFITDQTGPVVAVEADIALHAQIELVIRDLKEGAGWAHMPSGRFGANAAWLAIGAIAHNLARWTGRLGGIATSVITTPPCAAGSSPSPDTSPTPSGARRCTSPSNGRGATRSATPSTISATSMSAWPEPVGNRRRRPRCRRAEDHDTTDRHWLVAASPQARYASDPLKRHRQPGPHNSGPSRTEPQPRLVDPG